MRALMGLRIRIPDSIERSVFRTDDNPQSCIPILPPLGGQLVLDEVAHVLNCQPLKGFG
jgi:hypothetical protein